MVKYRKKGEFCTGSVGWVVMFFFSFFHRDFGFLKWFLCAFFAEALPPLLMDEISLAPVEVGTLPFFHPSC